MSVDGINLEPCLEMVADGLTLLSASVYEMHWIATISVLRPLFPSRAQVLRVGHWRAHRNEYPRFGPSQVNGSEAKPPPSPAGTSSGLHYQWWNENENVMLLMQRVVRHDLTTRSHQAMCLETRGLMCLETRGLMCLTTRGRPCLRRCM